MNQTSQNFNTGEKDLFTKVSFYRSITGNQKGKQFHITGCAGKSANAPVDEQIRPNFVTFNNEISSSYGNAIELEKLRDQLLKIKIELNKKTKEKALLKVENTKIEEDNRKNLLIIEEILKEAGRSTTSVVSNLIKQLQKVDMLDDENENSGGENALPPLENNNAMAPQMNLSSSHLIRLREILVISTLKKQVQSLNRIIQERDEEIEELKRNSKVVKYSKLENNYITNFNLLTELRKENEALIVKHEDLIKQFQQVLEERDYCRSMMNKFKCQFEDIKIKNRQLEEEKHQMQEIIKSNEEKLTYLNKCSNANIKGILKEKDTELASLRTEIEKLEKFKYDNPKLEKELHDLQKESKRSQNEIDKKEEENFKLKDEIKNLKEKICIATQGSSQKEKDFQQLKKESEALIKEKWEYEDIIKKMKKEIEDSGSILQDKEVEFRKREKLMNEEIRQIIEDNRVCQNKINELQEILKKGSDEKKHYDPEYLKIIPEVSFFQQASEKVSENQVLRINHEDINEGIFKTSAGVIIEPSINKNEFKDQTEEVENKSSHSDECEKDKHSKSFQSEGNGGSQVDEQNSGSGSFQEKRKNHSEDMGQNEILPKMINYFNSQPLERKNPKRNTVFQCQPYQINIMESEPQSLDPMKSYYTKNPASDFTRSKKSQSVTVLKSYSREPTLSKLVTEAIQNNEPFEQMINKPAFTNLIKK